MELQDLIVEGQIGFCAGVEKFDPSYGVQLSTYVTYWVKSYIRKALKNQEHEVRVPVHQQERGAEFLRPVMLDDDGDDTGAAHILVADNPDPIEMLTEEREREELENLMVCLTDREKKILQLRMQGFVLREVGRRVHLTRERTRHIEAGAVDKLRRLYNKRPPPP
jgi:RNA polymerase primary sigma factor